jgi:hypothetical protein
MYICIQHFTVSHSIYVVRQYAFCYFLQAAGDKHAALALDMFACHVRKYICILPSAVIVTGTW